MFDQLYFLPYPFGLDVTKKFSIGDISRTSHRRHMNLYIFGISVSRPKHLIPLRLCLTNFIFFEIPILARFPRAYQLVYILIRCVCQCVHIGCPRNKIDTGYCWGFPDRRIYRLDLGHTNHAASKLFPVCIQDTHTWRNNSLRRQKERIWLADVKKDAIVLQKL